MPSFALCLASLLSLAFAGGSTPVRVAAMLARDPGTLERANEAAAGTVATVQVLERPRWVRHRRAPRESLTQIAARYRVRPHKILKWNELGSEDDLERNHRLKIYTDHVPPPRRRLDYTVVEGDTWWTIATAHGVDVNDLRAYNWRPGRKLVVGEALRVWIDPVVYTEITRGPLEDAQGVRSGAISVGSPNEGRLVNAVQIPISEHYELRRPGSAYGTTYAVRGFVEALAAFRASTAYQGKIYVMSMSRARGGDLGDHLSHQSGRDVDILLPLRPGYPLQRHPRASRIDWGATWDLIEAFAQGGRTKLIFLEYRLQRRLYGAAKARGVSEERLDELLQYPMGEGEHRGLVVHSPGHTGHIHVRFSCGPGETECLG